MKEIMRVAVGQVFLCVEGQPGGRFVDLRIREKREGGRPGRTMALEIQQRSGLLAIAMGLLAVGCSLTPEEALDQSRTIGTVRNRSDRIPLRKHEWEQLDRILSGDADEARRTIQVANAMHRKLQRRMHIVQRCVQLMEVLGDQDAQQIDLLLTLAATGRPLPFSIHVGLAPSPENEELRGGVTH